MKLKTQSPVRNNSRLLLTSLALFISVIHFVPFYITVTSSLKPKTDLSSRWILPDQLYLDNFVNAIRNSKIILSVFNSIVITGCSVVLIVLVASMAAYPLARHKTRINSFLLKAIVSIMIIPPLSILVPLLSLVKNLNGISSFWAIILVLSTYQLPVSIFLFSKFISSTVPLALDEAAQLEGAGHFRVYGIVILPILKPIIATVVILTGVAIWNDYQFSVYLLQNPDKQVVTLAISSFFSTNASNLGQAAASTLIAVAPIVVLFVFLQKYFIKGMVEGSVK